jgi:hypothetical protein
MPCLTREVIPRERDCKEAQYPYSLKDPATAEVHKWLIEGCELAGQIAGGWEWKVCEKEKHYSIS